MLEKIKNKLTYVFTFKILVGTNDLSCKLVLVEVQPCILQVL